VILSEKGKQKIKFFLKRWNYLFLTPCIRLVLRCGRIRFGLGLWTATVAVWRQDQANG